ncbi:MAG: exo-alpha-sialidase [Clostridia bacterium]|nr:exo-alpha-sialidase [Clostridia bacterium]
MRKSIFYRLIALVIILSSAISLFTGCSKDKQDEESKKILLDISGYTIVRYDASISRITKQTAKLKTTIKDTLGLELTVATDWYNPSTPPDPNAKEILIDHTNRKESADALAKLKDSKEKDAFIIDITENKIVILGKTDYSTLRGISYFIKNYVMTSPEGSGLDITHGKNIMQDYNAVKNISIDGKLDMDIELISTVLGVPEENPSNILGYPSEVTAVSFPSIIELQHQKNKEDNGTLIAAVAVGEKALSNPLNTAACILESRDGGQSWNIIARPKETIDPTIWGGSMAHIYELPAQLGDMPAGTLLYSANSVNYNYKSHIGVYRSYDCGKTWEEFVIVARGGGLGAGVWEPVMFYNDSDGYLYCFYSDDSNRKYDQRIVYKRSKDGINWERAVDVCAFDKFEARPGMPVITKMGNGEFFLVYEYCGANGQCFIHYKKTSDITKWNPSDPGTLLEVKVGTSTYKAASSPSCVWTPAGGECGTLFATGRREFGGDGTNRVFVSFDYGKTWDSIENPLPYDWYGSLDLTDRIGYRPIMVLGSDPSVIHYINITDTPKRRVERAQYARLKVCD